MKRYLMRTTVALALCGSMLASAAAVIPKSYWQYHDAYANAVAAGNDAKTLDLIAKIEAVFASQKTDKEKAGILAPKYKKRAEIYKSRGQYDAAVENFKKYIPYGQYLNEADGVKLARAEIRALSPMPVVRALTHDTSGAKYFGARAEPKNGVYYGRCNPASVHAGESAVLCYVELGQNKISEFDYAIPKDGRMLEIALNFPKEAQTMDAVNSGALDAEIDADMQYLATLNVPVLLRVGAEMNVWTKLPDAASYKKAFQRIAARCHALAPAVGVVFSPNAVSNWNVDINDFYPGDSYVDWVGVSLYSAPYQNASMTTPSDSISAYYGVGKYTSSITKLRDIVERYGNRKPIVVAEGGFAHTLVKNGTNLTTSAVSNLDEFYSLLPVYFPSVKAVLYFDHYDAALGSTFDWALTDSSALSAAYDRNTQSNPLYIHDAARASAAVYTDLAGYREKTDTVELTAAVTLPGSNTYKTVFTLDGAVQKTENGHSLKLTNLLTGTHSLKMTMSEGKYSYSATYTLKRDANGVVSASLGAPAAGATPSGWAVGELSKAQQAQLIPASLAGQYGQKITRLEFCRTAVCLLEQKSGKSAADLLAQNGKTIAPATFSDTSDDAVLSAYALGIVSGVGDGRFAPNSAITRQEAAVMLRNIAGALGASTTVSGGAAFTDAGRIASWAKDATRYVAAARDVSSGKPVMGGVDGGRFAPNDHYTREQAFITMLRLYGAV